MKLGIIFATLLITIICCDAQESAETVIVEVTGIGKDAESAEKSALYSAVQQAVGSYLDQETVIKNEEIIHEKLLTVSQGFVEKYDVLIPAKERRDGSTLWEIKIKAVVKKSAVGAALRSAGVMQVAADGTSAWATQITKLKSREDAMALLEKVIPEIPRNLVLCKILQEDGQIQTQEDPKTGDLLTVIDLSISVNLEWWKTEAFPVLDAAFSALNLNNFNIKTHKIFYKSLELDDFRDRYHNPHWNRERHEFSGGLSLMETRTLSTDWEGWGELLDDSSLTLYDPIDQNCASSKVKSYRIPSTYATRINEIDLKYETLFTISFTDKNGNDLHNIDYFVSDFSDIRSGPFNLSLGFPFFFSIDWGSSQFFSSFTDSFLARLKIPLEADILKKTRNVIVKPGRFGAFRN